MGVVQTGILLLFAALLIALAEGQEPPPTTTNNSTINNDNNNNNNNTTNNNNNNNTSNNNITINNNNNTSTNNNNTSNSNNSNNNNNNSNNNNTNNNQGNATGNASDAGGKIILECDGTKMKATLNFSAIFGEAAEGNPITWTLNNCNDSVYNISGNTIQTDFQLCSYEITQATDIISQEAMLTVEIASNETSTIITRGGQSAVFMLFCSLDRRLNVSTGGVSVSAAGEQTFTKIGQTNITAQMKFYDTNLFNTEAAKPLTVTDFEPIFIQITALENQQLFKFIVEDCYATPTSNPMDTTQYLYFNEKCPLDSTVETYPQHGGHNKFSHSIKAFRFIQVQGQVFFHCRLLVCKNSDNSTECTQNCATGQRRRRRALEEGALERVYVNSEMVRYKKKPSCKNTNCPLNSRCYDIHPAVCRCDQGFVMDWHTKTCTKENTLMLTNLHLDQEFIPAYSYPTSPEFIRLAQHIEYHLMTSYILHRDVIKGVKVIGAREGSVVVDVRLLHSDTVTSQQAVRSFIASVTRESRINMEILRIKTHITPVLVQVENQGEQMSATVIAVVGVAVILVAVMFMVSVILFFKRRSSGKKEVTSVPSSYDNKGVQMNYMS